MTFQPIQQALFAERFDLKDEPSAVRAARVVTQVAGVVAPGLQPAKTDAWRMPALAQSARSAERVS